jgi:hypothetical protein
MRTNKKERRNEGKYRNYSIKYMPTYKHAVICKKKMR